MFVRGMNPNPAGIALFTLIKVRHAKSIYSCSFFVIDTP